MKILITAFEPFGECNENSAHLAMDLLPENTQKHKLVKATLPVVYFESIDKLKKLIDKNNPDVVICLGQAAGAFSIRIERVAVNMDDTNARDNKNNLHVDKTIIEDGPVAYFASLPTREMMEASKKAEIPAHLSYTAGNYVCNHIMYGLLHYINNKNIIAGFIHIPSTPAQIIDKNNQPAMSSKDVSTGLLAMIAVL